MQNRKGDFFDEMEDVGYDEETVASAEESSPSDEPEKSSSVYNLIYDLGDGFLYYSKTVFLSVFKIIAFPFALLAGIIKEFRAEAKSASGHANESFSQQASAFREDYRRAKKAGRSRAKGGRKQSRSALFRQHKKFIGRSLNYILPAAAVVIMLLVFRYYGRLNLALQVTYNNVDIGYIESEKVFNEAKNILEERLTLDNKEPGRVVSLPEYKIAVVKLNELSDSAEICEKIIENSDSGLTTACGIYVDNKFIGSVKNESDASGVFKSIKTDYCKKNNIDADNTDAIVGMVEEVSYVQGLYNENTIIDSKELKDYIITQTKSESSVYVAGKSDTPESVSAGFGITTDQLFALNPGLGDGESIKEGMEINVIKSIPFVNVTISKTETVTQEIKHKTVEIETDALYKGTKQTVTQGQDGEEIITNLITYVNDEIISTKAISKLVTKPAVDEQIYIGTRPVPTAYFEFYGVGQGAFIWPAVKAHTVTSPFGYRTLRGESNFHRGVDISGAGVLGTPIIASASGVVEKVTAGNTGYGYSVLIDHGGGIKTRYAHLLAGSILVQPGDQVVQGQMIAQLGSTGNSTGPHVHFEIMYNNAYTNPLDYLTR